MNKSTNSLMSALVAAASLALLSGTASAAEQCKGKTASACGTSASCNWVAPYTTKNGNKVDGYCRSKGTKATDKSSARETEKAASRKTAAASVR